MAETTPPRTTTREKSRAGQYRPLTTGGRLASLETQQVEQTKVLSAIRAEMVEIAKLRKPLLPPLPPKGWMRRNTA